MNHASRLPAFLVIAAIVPAYGTEPITVGSDTDGALDLEPIAPAEIVDPRVPQRTLTTRFDVLVGKNGRAIRGEIVQSAGKDWVDRRALADMQRKTYPIRFENSEAIEYWLRDESYELLVRAMNNRVDGLPGDPDAPK